MPVDESIINLNGGVAITLITDDDLFVVVDDPSGTPVTKKATRLTVITFPDGAVILDQNGNEVIKILKTAAAVNEVTFKNNSTGQPPIMQASGETNVSMQISPKGSGVIILTDGTDLTKQIKLDLSGATTLKILTLISSHTDNRSITYPDATTTLIGKTETATVSGKTYTAPKILDGDGIVDDNGNEILKIAKTTSAVNEITIKNAATLNDVQIQATGGDTDVSAILVPKGAGMIYGNLETIMIALGDETTALSTGTAVVKFRMPYAFKVLKVKASLTTVSSSGLPAFDINEGGVSILSTTLTIDANEKTSKTATTPVVISDSVLADDAEISIDIDTAGTGAAGAKIYIIGYATAKPA